MMKMEKNFIAVLEKRHPRKPYENYSLAELTKWFLEEVNELYEALKNCQDHPSSKERKEAKLECADVSNFVDFLFEKLS
jgi:NTP pyrophosphatase (non-canonical NTP hydrolase)